LVAARPNQRVVDWIDSIDSERVYLSVITIGEIRKGIEKLPDSKRKLLLREWLEVELFIRFRGRILPIDIEVMLAWGEMVARLELTGKKMSLMDSLIASIALHGNLRIATRNQGDFQYSGVETVNPWNG
jgi:tRNA(fMet)-specific endonuclease VapC